MAADRHGDGDGCDGTTLQDDRKIEEKRSAGDGTELVFHFGRDSSVPFTS